MRYEDIAELGDGELEFNYPVNLVCGENGVGKSAALLLIARALGLTATLEGAHKEGPKKASTGAITASALQLRIDGNLQQLAVAEGIAILADAGEIRAHFIDPGLQVPHILDRLRGDANPADLIEGVTPIDLTAEDKETIAELTGKKYEAVEIFEIDDYGGFEVFPFVRVRYAGVTYTAPEMGLGEFSLLYLYWKLRSLPENTVVLLEEPESFAAPRSQRALIDYLAYLCNEMGHLAIVSSHSGTIAERMPNRAISLCSRAGADVVFVRDPSPGLLVDRVALYLRRRLVLIVEDESARAFTRALIEQLDSRVAADLNVMVAGSNSEIASALRAIRPTQGEAIRFVGVLDGDQKDLIPTGVHWPTILLPGGRDPDFEMMQSVTKRTAGDLETLTKISSATWVMALSAAEGLDHHDWTKRMCDGLGLSLMQFARLAVPLWASDAGDAPEGFAKSLRAALGLG